MRSALAAIALALGVVVGAIVGVDAAPATAASAAQTHALPAAAATTLYQLVHDADVIARVWISDPEGTVAAEGASRAAVIAADMIEVLKGTADPGSVVFAPRDPDSVDEYAAGEERVLFLQHIEDDPERAGTRAAKVAEYVSLQDGADEIVVTTSTTLDAFVAAIRAYAAVDALADPATQIEARRRVAAELLASPDPRLASLAAADLAAVGETPVFTTADLPRLDPVIDDRRVPIATRVALLARLEQQQLVFGPARWVQLLRKTKGPDLLVVIRAAATRPSAGITAELCRLLEEQDLAAATAAAVAVGHPGMTAAVEPLARSLGRDVPALQLAALVSLGRIGTLGARHVLELAADSHPDPSTRRRASAEAIALARRQGTTLAPTLTVSPAAALVSSAAALLRPREGTLQ